MGEKSFIRVIGQSWIAVGLKNKLAGSGSRAVEQSSFFTEVWL